MIVDLKDSAEKEFKKIEQGNPRAAQKINITLKQIESSPNPKKVADCKKMKAHKNRYIWRAGPDCRIIGDFKNNELIIEEIIEVVAVRESAYLDLPTERIK